VSLSLFSLSPDCLMALVSSRASETQFKDAVFKFLKEGISSLDSLGNLLLSADKNNMKDFYHCIKEQIQKSELKTVAAEEKAKEELSKVDEKCIQLTIEKKSLEEERERKVLELDSLQKQLNSFKELEESSRGSMRDAERELQCANEALSNAEANVRRNQTGRDAGIGVMFIPIIGPLIGIWDLLICESGIGLLAGFQPALDEAQKTAREADQNVNDWRSRVSHYSNEATNFSNQVQNTKEKIDSNSKQLQEVEKELSHLSTLRMKIAEVQEKLQHCTTFLSSLAGKVQAADIQTKYLIMLDPIIRVFEDIAKHVFQLSNNHHYQLLFETELKCMIDRLEITNGRTRAIGQGSQASDDEQFI
uniref:Uncharacterized protein n=1 Tax=Latimeria chalumnae TaxID=7897 RepID=H2ZVE5_LATCH